MSGTAITMGEGGVHRVSGTAITMGGGVHRVSGTTITMGTGSKQFQLSNSAEFGVLNLCTSTCLENEILMYHSNVSKCT